MNSCSSMLLAAAVFVSGLSGVGAAQVLVDQNVSDVAGGIQLQFCVENQGPEPIRDFHIRGIRGTGSRGVAQPGVSGPAGTPGEQWNATDAGSWFHWWSREHSIPAQSERCFTVVIAGVTRAEWERDKRAAKWHATRNAKQSFGRGDRIAYGYQDRHGADLQILPIAVDLTVTAMVEAAPGVQVPIAIHAPAHPFESYVLALALSEGPGLPLAPGLILPLSYDPLLEVSLALAWSGSAPLGGFHGSIDATGGATAQLDLPPDPTLDGLELWLAGFLYRPSSAQFFFAVSNAEPIRLSL